MKEKLRGRQGITLIALVITIIVLLILAGVSIAMLTGDNGILTQANNANIQQSHATVKEAVRLAYNEWRLEVETSNNTKVASTEKVTIQGREEKAEAEPASTFFDYLVSKGYIDEETRILNVENLTGSKQSLGNGTGTEDVYKLEEENGEYKVVYYEDGTTNTVIDTISDTVADTGDNWDGIATDQKYFTFSFDQESKTATLTGVKDEYAVKGYYNDRGYTIAILDGDNLITDIVIPEHVKDDNNIEYTVTGIGDSAFKCETSTDRDSLFTSFKLPNTIVSIGSNAFENCVEMQNIVMSKNVKTIGNRSFCGCSKLKNIELPQYITRIEQDTFAQCELLESITIPSGVTSVRENAFSMCHVLKNVTIEGDLTYIGGGAFYGCTQIKEISIQGDLEYVGDYAFGLWGADQIINFEISAQPETGWGTRWDYDYYSSSTKIESQINWGVKM